MSWRFTDFPYWIRKNPDVIRERILTTFLECHGDRDRTVEKLGISKFLYHRYVRALGIKETIRSLRVALKERGEYVSPRYADTKDKTKPESAFTGPPLGAEPTSHVS